MNRPKMRSESDVQLLAASIPREADGGKHVRTFGYDGDNNCILFEAPRCAVNKAMRRC